MATLTLDYLRGYTLGERRDSVPVAYQWDQGHSLQIKVPKEVTTAELHYWHPGMAKSEAYEPTSITAESDGTYTILGSVPNKYFEYGTNLSVFVVVTDDDAAITTYEGRIQVVQRDEPEDYVDTDPDNTAAKIMAISFSDPNHDGHIIVTLST